ncbi:MAG: hypothetical protein IK121_10580, partial [Lachnospiraceae bacterium]|nr:hypothetical protein [Lachnospiraceae bacterium]
IIVLFTAVASYFYYKSDNAVGPNLITAFVGVVLSALVTLVLLNGQTKDEEDKERKMKLYNAKLEVYSDFVFSMYELLSMKNTNQDLSENFSSLRTKLLGKVCFYVNDKKVIEGIKEELDNVKDLNDDNKMAKAFAGITNILQNDLRKEGWIDSQKDVLDLWGKFEEISANTNNDNEVANALPILDEVAQRQDQMNEESKRLDNQAWHFIMWSDIQLDKLKEGFKELSLVEYGEYWRTNLVKQVGKDDIIMLFRRGGYGYVGAYRAIGWRVFYFEEEREESLGCLFLKTGNNVIPLFSATLILILTFYIHTFSNDASYRGSRR